MLLERHKYRAATAKGHRNAVRVLGDVPAVPSAWRGVALLVLLPVLMFGQSSIDLNGSERLPSTLPVSQIEAADSGNMQAELEAAKAYYEGMTVRRNYLEAWKWFSAAAKQGSVEATAWLGSCYLYGRGVPQDLGNALILIQSAAQADDPIGLRFLGVMYAEGQGVPQNYAKAYQSFLRATRKLDPYSFDQLGVLYLRGLGVKKSVYQAAKFFTKGARLGDSWSQLNLGELYESGNAPQAKGTPRKPNYAMAVTLYGDSVGLGNRVAAYKLGQMYEAGEGVKQDYEQALEYYRQSANRYYPPAQLALGNAAENGLGTESSPVYAYIWYSLAADQGNDEGAKRLTLLKPKMNADELRQAATLVSRMEGMRTNNN
jgi:TPR repeat protein